MPTSVEDALGDYLGDWGRHLQARNRSPLTVEGYLRGARQFAASHISNSVRLAPPAGVSDAYRAPLLTATCTHEHRSPSVCRPGEFKATPADDDWTYVRATATYYDLLGVEPDATPQELRAAYQMRAQLCTPTAMQGRPPSGYGRPPGP